MKHPGHCQYDPAQFFGGVGGVPCTCGIAERAHRDAVRWAEAAEAAAESACRWAEGAERALSREREARERAEAELAEAKEALAASPVSRKDFLRDVDDTRPEDKPF